MTMQCSKCSALNPVDALFCYNCGSGVVSASVSGRGCARCGAVGPDDALFCFNCGGGITSTNETVAPRTDQEPYRAPEPPAPTMVSVPLDDVAWGEPDPPIEAPPVAEPVSSSKLRVNRTKLLASAGAAGVALIVLIVAIASGSNDDSEAARPATNSSPTTVRASTAAPTTDESTTTVKSVTVPMTARVPVAPTSASQSPATPTTQARASSTTRTTLAPVQTLPPTTAATTTTIPATTTTLPRCGGKRDVNVRIGTRSAGSPYEIRLRISNNTNGSVTIEQIGFSLITTDPTSGTVSEEYYEWDVGYLTLDPDENFSDYASIDVGDDSLEVRLDNYQVDVSEFDSTGRQVCN